MKRKIMAYKREKEEESTNKKGFKKEGVDGRSTTGKEDQWGGTG